MYFSFIFSTLSSGFPLGSTELPFWIFELSLILFFDKSEWSNCPSGETVFPCNNSLFSFDVGFDSSFVVFSAWLDATTVFDSVFAYDKLGVKAIA